MAARVAPRARGAAAARAARGARRPRARRAAVRPRAAGDGGEGGGSDEDGSEKGEGKDEEKEYDVIIRGFGSSQGGKYGLGPRTDQLLDFSASPDVLFICLLLTVFLIIGVIMGGPPPQSYEQEYAAEIEAYRAKKAEDARAEAQAAAAALSAPPPVAEGTPAPPLD